MGSRVETLPGRPTWLGSSYQWPWWRSPLQLHSSRATPAMPSSFRSRDLTLVLESLELPTLRRTELYSGRSQGETMRESGSTATLTTPGRPSLSSTPLASMGSGSSRATTSPPEVRTLLTPPPTLPGSPRSTTTSTTMTVSPNPSLSTHTIPLITLSTCWVATLLVTWLAASSPHPDPDLPSPLNPEGKASPRVRSSWIGSLKVSTSTSVPSKAKPETVSNSRKCAILPYLYLFFWTDLHVFNKKNTK